MNVPNAGLQRNVQNKESPLGHKVDYVSVYTPSLLCPIPRGESRRMLGLDPGKLPFQGMDVWTAYEVSWLDGKGKPHVAVAKFFFPANSHSMVESKSFKLYLNSYNQTRFNNLSEVVKTLESDLSIACGGPVIAQVMPLNKVVQAGLGHFAAEYIDGLDITVTDYSVNPNLLSADQMSPMIRESLCSDLLKTNCPVTGQPDWASVMVSYFGRPIDREGLLKYLISYREHQDYHENCVERMYCDIMSRCKPERLTVTARFTRRGGLDINPFRTNCGEEEVELRLARQ